MYEELWQFIEKTDNLNSALRRLTIPSEDQINKENPKRWLVSKDFLEPLLYPVEIRERHWITRNRPKRSDRIEYKANDKLHKRFSEIKQRLTKIIKERNKLKHYKEQIKHLYTEGSAPDDDTLTSQIQTFLDNQNKLLSVLEQVEDLQAFIDDHGVQYWTDRIEDDIDALLAQAFLTGRWTGQNWRPPFYKNVQKYSRNKYDRDDYEAFLADRRKFNALYHEYIDQALNTSFEDIDIKEIKANLYQYNEALQNLDEAKQVAHQYSFSFTTDQGTLLHGTPIRFAEWTEDDFLRFPQEGLQTESKPHSHTFFEDTISLFLFVDEDQIREQISEHQHSKAVYIVIKQQWINNHADQFFYSHEANQGRGYAEICKEYGFTAIENAPRTLRNEKGWNGSMPFWHQEVQSIKPIPYNAIKAFLCGPSFKERLTYFMKALGKRDPQQARPIYTFQGEKLWP